MSDVEEPKLLAELSTGGKGGGRTPERTEKEQRKKNKEQRKTKREQTKKTLGNKIKPRTCQTPPM